MLFNFLLKKLNLVTIRLKLTLSFALGLIGLIFIGGLGSISIEKGFTLNQISLIEEEITKQAMIHDLQSHLGYYGATHLYLDYLIKRDETSVQLYQRHESILQHHIEEMRLTHYFTDDDLKAISLISKLLNSYNQKFLLAKNLTSEGATIAEIDKITSTQEFLSQKENLTIQCFLYGCHDKKDIAFRQHSLTSFLGNNEFEEYNKITAEQHHLHNIQKLMGLDGIIDHYKKYIIRHDVKLYNAFMEMHKQINEEIALYEQLEETNDIGKEQQYLADLKAMLAKYHSNIQQAKDMLQQGASPREIATALAVNDSSYKVSLYGLSNALQDELATFLNHEKKNIVSEINLHNQVIIYSIILAIIGFTVFGTLLNTSIFTGFDEATSAINQIQRGETKNIIETSRKDEVGTLLNTLEIMRNELDQSLTLTDYTIEKQMSAQREVSAKDEEVKVVRRFEMQLEEITALITKASGSVHNVSSRLSTNAQRMQEQTENAMHNTKQASQHINHTAESSHKIADTTFSVNQQTEFANDISRKAVLTSHEASANISEFVASTEKIDNFVQMVTDIANKTNMLALNASIEAARAGEAGRGFSVVAHEVKELANQTSSVTSQITELLSAIHSQGINASESIQQIGKVIQESSEVTQHVSSAMSSQSQTAQDISQSAHLMAEQISIIDHEINDVAGTTSDINENANNLYAASQELDQAIALQQQYTENFIKEINAIRASQQQEQPSKSFMDNGVDELF